MATWRETFYHCKKCGSIVMKYGTEGCTPSCCGDQMEVLVPHTEDEPGEGAPEKHLPTLERGKIITVHVGEQEHPMDPDHYIDWIYIATEMGSQMVKLKPGIRPLAHFALNGDIPLKLYAHCTKHGLWMTELFESMQDDDE